MASNIHLEHRPDGAAVIWLARPERNNAFDEALIRELSDVLDDIDKDPNVNAVVLAGEGESFCAGADLAWMRRAATYDRAENLADATNVAALLYRLDQLSKPTIARVQGAVYGDGVGLVACCDIAIANNDARFCLSEVRGPYCIPRSPPPDLDVKVWTRNR